MDPRLLTVLIRVTLALAASTLLAANGCTTNLKAATAAHSEGDFRRAADEIKSIKPTDRDYVWYLLERGKMEQDAGEWDAAIASYETAKETVESVDEQEARGSIEGASQSAQSLVAGDNLADYRILRFERVLLHANLALVLMLKGDYRGAAVECRNVVDYQEQIKQEVGLDDAGLSVESADEAIMSKVPRGASSDFTAGSVFENRRVKAENKEINAVLRRDSRLGAIDERVPWGHVVSWTAFMASGDRVEARGTAAELDSLMSGSAFNARVQALTNAHELGEHVVVLVDAGLGVIREEFTVTIPIPIPTVGVTSFVAPFPKLVFRTDGRPRSILVNPGGAQTKADLVDSIDGLFASDFDRHKLDIYLPPIIRGASRAIASGIAQAQTDNTLAKLAIAGGTFAWGSVEEADLRTWSALPAAQYAAIVPRPRSGVLLVQTKGGGESRTYRVPVPSGPSLVYLRAVDSTRGSIYSAPLSVGGASHQAVAGENP